MKLADLLRRRVPARFELLVSGRQFGQFISVGAVGAVADTTVLMLAVVFFDLPDLSAKLVGIEAAIILMFLLNERWTFAGSGSVGPFSLSRRLVKSHFVRAGGVGVQLTIFWVLIHSYSVRLSIAGTDIWFVLASLLSIAIAMVVNYLLESLFTWQIQTTSTEGDGGVE